jgi:hypothetical protein
MPSQRPHLAVFRLVEVAEVETLVDGDPADIRVEVFEDAANPGQYRCRTWRLLEYGLHPPGFRDDDDGLATVWEDVFVPWSVPGGFVTEDPFFASSKEAALEAVLDDLRVYLAVTRHAEDEGEPPVGAPPAASA